MKRRLRAEKTGRGARDCDTDDPVDKGRRGEDTGGPEIVGSVVKRKQSRWRGGSRFIGPSERKRHLSSPAHPRCGVEGSGGKSRSSKKLEFFRGTWEEPSRGLKAHHISGTDQVTQHQRPKLAPPGLKFQKHGEVLDIKISPKRARSRAISVAIINAFHTHGLFCS